VEAPETKAARAPDEPEEATDPFLGEEGEVLSTDDENEPTLKKESD
jgi:hypothetical protein